LEYFVSNPLFFPQANNEIQFPIQSHYQPFKKREHYSLYLETHIFNMKMLF